jgi:hypothetical protein
VFRRVVLGVCALALVASGCTGDGSPDAGSKPAILDLPTPEAHAGGEIAPTPVPEGRATNEFELDVETCFNTYEFYFEQIDETRERTTVVDCRRPHDGEVYAIYDHPAEQNFPYPGGSQLREWSNIQCLQSFEDFVGTPFVLSLLQIGSVAPGADDWDGESDASDGTKVRSFRCYVFAPDAQLSGSMGGSGF